MFDPSPDERSEWWGQRRAKLALEVTHRERSERCAGWGNLPIEILVMQASAAPPDRPSASHLESELRLGPHCSPRRDAKVARASDVPEVGLDQRAKLRRDLGAKAEP